MNWGRRFRPTPGRAPFALLLGTLLYLRVFALMQRWVSGTFVVPPDLTRPQPQPRLGPEGAADVAAAADADADVDVDADADAGPEPPQQHNRLEFIHITKTAGSSIEEAAARSGIRWGACHWKTIGKFGTNCTGTWRLEWPLYNRTRVPGGFSRGLLGEPWHTPHRWFRRNPYEGSSTFVVVRNPYERCVSEYYSKFGGYKGPDRNDPEVMNSVLRSKVRPPEERNGKTRGVHFLPQHLYVYDGDGRRVVKHVLRFENLDEEFPSLMRQYGLPVELPGRHNVRNATRSHLTVANLTAETIAAINRRYVDDFLRFRYRVVTRAEELSDPSLLGNKSFTDIF